MDYFAQMSYNEFIVESYASRYFCRALYGCGKKIAQGR